MKTSHRRPSILMPLLWTGRILSYAGFRAGNLVSPREELERIQVVDFMADRRGAEERLAKVRQALRLIGRSDASELVRIQRYLRRIMIMHSLGDSNGWYWHDLRACFLDRGFVIETAPERISLTIVHEAAHARIRRAGIHMEPANRARVEVICSKSALRWARKLEDTQILAEARRRREYWETRSGMHESVGN
jgi:hypothetical protein